MNTSMGFGMWIFWIVGIVALVWIAKLMMPSSSSSSSSLSESPKDILEKRYASGEIDQDEFENMKKELEK